MGIEDEVSEGDPVVVRWTARGTHEGEFMGMPPSGNAEDPCEPHRPE